MFAMALLELTLRGVLSDIPRDPGSIVAYVLLLFIIAVIVYGSRGGARSAGSGEESDPVDPDARSRTVGGGSRSR